MMRRLAVVLALLPVITSAAAPPPIEDDFLDYLAELEDSSDDWTWFAEDQQVSPVKKDTPPVNKPRQEPKP